MTIIIILNIVTPVIDTIILILDIINYILDIIIFYIYYKTIFIFNREKLFIYFFKISQLYLYDLSS